jgi:OmcA/MtrC family decaheme c-type cytochrome
VGDEDAEVVADTRLGVKAAVLREMAQETCMNMECLKRFCLVSVVAVMLGVIVAATTAAAQRQLAAPRPPVVQASSPGMDTTPINAATLFKENWRDLTFDSDCGIIGVPTITNGKATVRFKVTSKGRPVIGLPYDTISFAIAKLQPGTDGGASHWVNYNVYNPVNNTAKYPSMERANKAGVFKDNGDGTYSYTFALDISTVKGLVDTAVAPPAGNYSMKDLGDLAYDPNLVHRVVVGIYGKKSSDTWDYLLLNTYERVADFMPGAGKLAPAESRREIVSRDLCLNCHTGSARFLAHHGTRQNPQYCVVCHTEQMKVGHHEAPRDPNDTNKLASEPILDTNGVQARNEFGDPAVSGTHVVNGFAVAGFTAFVHKIHMGKRLKLSGYDYNQMARFVPGVSFDDNASNPRCTNCHAAATAATPQGDNWKRVPSRTACGSCHDGVDFATAGTTTHKGPLGDGGQQTTDKSCAACHPAVRSHVVL